MDGNSKVRPYPAALLRHFGEPDLGVLAHARLLSVQGHQHLRGHRRRLGQRRETDSVHDDQAALSADSFPRSPQSGLPGLVGTVVAGYDSTMLHRGLRSGHCCLR